MMWAVLLGTAAAQPLPGLDFPRVAADLYRPSIDGGPFLVTESGRISAGPVAGAHATWGRDLLRVVIDGEPSTVVQDAAALHLGARLGWGPLQVGFTAPGYVLARVDGEARTVLGDPTLEAKVAVEVAPVRLGALVRAGTSLGAADWQLGYPGPFLEAGVVGEIEQGPITFTINGGYRAVPLQQLDELVLDDAWWARGGLALGVSPRWRPALELMGQVPVARVSVPGATPLEGLIHLQHRWRSGASVQVGAGRGLTNAIGTPRWRAVVSVGWARPADASGPGPDPASLEDQPAR